MSNEDMRMSGLVVVRLFMLGYGVTGTVEETTHEDALNQYK